MVGSDHLETLIGGKVSAEQAEAVIAIVTALARSYTRGQGFTPEPGEDIRAVILTASARLLSNPSGLLMSETVGPESVDYRSAFTGWTIAELFVLNRYRVRAQ